MLGENIRKYREHNSFTQEELAAFLGCSREVISYYENGSRIPKVELLNRMADLFGVELHALLEESPEIVDENIVLAFRRDNSTLDDVKEIASFKKIIKNYLKMERLVAEHGL